LTLSGCCPYPLYCAGNLRVRVISCTDAHQQHRFILVARLDGSLYHGLSVPRLVGGAFRVRYPKFGTPIVPQIMNLSRATTAPPSALRSSTLLRKIEVAGLWPVGEPSVREFNANASAVCRLYVGLFVNVLGDDGCLVFDLACFAVLLFFICLVLSCSGRVQCLPVVHPTLGAFRSLSLLRPSP
jgi:hypothetical protein